MLTRLLSRQLPSSPRALHVFNIPLRVSSSSCQETFTDIDESQFEEVSHLYFVDMTFLINPLPDVPSFQESFDETYQVTQLNGKGSLSPLSDELTP